MAMILMILLAHFSPIFAKVYLHHTHCPDGTWGLWQGNCYRLFMPDSDGHTWIQAQHSCVRQGANLISVHSAEEYQHISDLVRQNLGGKPFFFWIGMFLDRNELRLNASWADGSPVDFGNPVESHGEKPWAGTWAKREVAPDISTLWNEKCVFMTPPSGAWDVYGCSVNGVDGSAGLWKGGFICKRKAAERPSITAESFGNALLGGEGPIDGKLK